jgi:hypothetical protein
MADYEAKPGQGSVWANDRKTEEWHADWRGKILLPNGDEHYIDLWDNDRNGKVWRGVKIGNKVENSGAPAQRSAPAPTAAAVSVPTYIDDEIPF